MKNALAPHVRVAIVGSGFAGLGTAIRLGQSGFNDYLVFERSHDVGGVWRDNTYPGCACDVDSHLYSFSFARNPQWSRTFSPQREIWDYLRGCAARFGVLPKIKFNHPINRATWDATTQRWHLETPHQTFTADVLVSAVGALSEPAFPPIAGLETFRGTSFHSAQWDHHHVLRGKRVAVIGTGASAIQFVPAIQREVASLTLFQRTPPWILPRRDRPLGAFERTVLRHSNAAQWLRRAQVYGVRELLALTFLDVRAAKLTELFARRHLEQAVRDPALRAKLRPTYAVGCKRILLSDDYYPAVSQPNVELITAPITKVIPEGIVTHDGALHAVDTIIFGTGFAVQSFPFGKRVRGKHNRTLAETWKNGMSAHLGTSVSGFPNLFLLQGPNTGLGHSSVITMIESQIEHIVNALRFMSANAIATVEPRASAQAAFVAAVDAKTQGTVWASGGCSSWYLHDRGRNTTLWPGFTFTFKRRVEPFNPSEYLLVAKHPGATAPNHAEHIQSRPHEVHAHG